jgi:F-type H+-transporting ATPase subunit b
VDAVFETLAEFAREIVVEIGYEVANEPLRIVAEVVQFALLLGIVWVVAIGFGKRRGFVANMIAERTARIEGNLALARDAGPALEAAQAKAADIMSAAEAEAAELLAAAEGECAAAERTARSEADAEALRITSRATSALETERREMELQLREQLVETVCSATRSIMNEKLSVAEQRALIEDAVAESMGSITAPAAKAGKAQARVSIEKQVAR